MPEEYQRRLGERLRAIRTQQDMTLQQVEERSDGEWKAVVVGSYERGDRAVSVSKLARLADFYGVPVSQLLPPDDEVAAAAAGPEPPAIVIDLTAGEVFDSEDLAPVTRFVHAIQMQRGDYNGRMLTLRRDDLSALAIVLGEDVDDLVGRLEERGLLVAG